MPYYYHDRARKDFLAKSVPDLAGCICADIVDIYIPKESRHRTLRIRKSGSRLELTKKLPVKGRDSSIQKEVTIALTPEEYSALSSLGDKRLEKTRFYYNLNGRIAEIDVFRGRLKGLVLVDFEFKTQKEKESFKMPDFCMADVTQEEFAAGGMLCGKSYSDIRDELKRFGYKKLFVNLLKK